MNLSQASILLFAATASMPSPSVGLEVSSSSALLQSSTHEESRRLGKRTERSKKKKRMFGGSSSSGDELLPPFTNPEPKDVCIQEMQAYKIKGSATPIDGKTGLTTTPPFNVNPACASVIDFTGTAAFLSTLNDYYSCLATPAAGPVIIGKWWFDRDIPEPPDNSGQFSFEPGYVCAEITGSESNSRTKFELWEQKFINLPLGNFTEVRIFDMYYYYYYHHVCVRFL